MADDKNDHVVIAFFDSAAAADAATEALKTWDNANQDIKLGAVGVLVKQDGKLDMRLPHKAGKGAKVGAVLGIITGILSGGVTLIGGALAGALGGGAVGAFMKKSVGLAKEDIDRLGAQLNDGGAALVVVCDDYEVAGTELELTRSGGKVQKFVVSAEAVDEARQAVETAEAKAGAAMSDVEVAAKGAASEVKVAATDAAAMTKEAVDDAAAVTKDAARDVASTARSAAGDVEAAAKKAADDMTRG